MRGVGWREHHASLVFQRSMLARGIEERFLHYTSRLVRGRTRGKRRRLASVEMTVGSRCLGKTLPSPVWRASPVTSLASSPGAAPAPPPAAAPEGPAQPR